VFSYKLDLSIVKNMHVWRLEKHGLLALLRATPGVLLIGEGACFTCFAVGRLHSGSVNGGAATDIHGLWH